jgi:hypothetical protein
MQTLSRSDLRSVAPSIFASQPYEAMSPRYKFIGTDGVLDIMDGLGFQPVQAVQSKARKQEKRSKSRCLI